MKVVHIEAKLKGKVILPKELIKELPKKIIVFTTIQLIDSLADILSQLKSSGKEPFTVKTKHTKHEGQLLGCNVEQYSEYTEKDFDAFLYVGDGLFHPKALAWKNSQKKVFAYNPFTGKFSEISGEDIERIKRRNKAAFSKFLVSEKVGILITLKPGQYQLKQAMKLANLYPEKKFFFFLDNTYNFDSLEDFPFIDVWINSACPRIGYDDSIRLNKMILNLNDVLEYEKQ